MKPSSQPTTPAYKVTAIDNFDFYESSGVPTQCRDAEHALSVAKGILQRSLDHEHGQSKDPTNAAELFDRWDSFGDYPSIHSQLDPPFNPSEYAQQRAAKICDAWQPGRTAPPSASEIPDATDEDQDPSNIPDWGSSGARLDKTRIIEFLCESRGLY